MLAPTGALLVALSLATLAACPADTPFEPTPDTAVVADTDAAADVDPGGDAGADADAEPDGLGACACMTCAEGGCCARGCASTVVAAATSDFAAATIDRAGVPAVVTYHRPGPQQVDLVLRRFDGVASWPVTTLVEHLDDGFDLVAARDSSDALQLFVQRVSGPVSGVDWVHPNGLGGWAATPLGDFADCVRPGAGHAPDGHLHASCVTSEPYELHILRDDGARGWPEVATLPNVGVTAAGDVPSVWPIAWTLDAQARPHVAFSCCSLTAPQLVYTHWDGTAWVRESFGVRGVAPGANRRMVAIGLDGEGYPHMLAQDSNGEVGRLDEHHWNGTTWVVDTIDTAATTAAPMAQKLRLVADSRAHIHVVYSDDDRLGYRVHDGAAWSDEALSPDAVSAESAAALVVDAADVPHVVYRSAAGALRWWTPPEPSAGR